MSEVVTYSLINHKQNSDRYYTEIASLSKEIWEVVEHDLCHLLDNFQAFVSNTGLEPLRSKAEYAIEALTLGVYWHSYANQALSVRKLPLKTMKLISSLRKRFSILKPLADTFKGILLTLYFNSQDPQEQPDAEPDMHSLELLLGWLAAVGDFDKDVARLNNWIKYFSYKDKEYIQAAIHDISKIAIHFEEKYKQQLSCYTPKVNSFIKEAEKNRSFREDTIFCRRREVEYHLNMVGAEIMNQAFRSSFLNTNQKMLLLPACIRSKNSTSCKSKKTPNGYSCTNCTPACRVSQFTSLGDTHGFSVYVIPHESDALSFSAGEDTVGIVGVACVLQLLSGGWKAKDLNFVPQCVLLDYCGCKNHWHDEGIVTDINFNKLCEVLQIDNMLKEQVSS